MKPDCLETFVSVIVVTRNQSNTLEQRLPELQSYMELHFSDYEILIVDQRSDDGTLQKIDILLKKIPCIRFIELSFRVTEDVAMAAGLENSIGDYVIYMDLESDPHMGIRQMIEKCRGGSDIVLGISNSQESIGYRCLRPFATWMLGRIGYTLPRGAGNFMAISRRAANAVMSVGRFHHQFLIRLSKTGYAHGSFPYDALDGKTKKKSLKAGFQQLVRMMIYNSTLPLRWMSLLGFLGSTIAFLFALYSFVLRLVMENIAAGWASSVMFQSFMFLLMFAMLAFFGEYLARLLDEQSHGREYAVVEEKHSSVLLDENRLNVLSESIEKPKQNQTV